MHRVIFGELSEEVWAGMVCITAKQENNSQKVAAAKRGETGEARQLRALEANQQICYCTPGVSVDVRVSLSVHRCPIVLYI